MPLHSRLLRSVLGLAMLILAACQPSVLPSATPSPTALQVPTPTPTPAVLETVTPASPTPTPAVLETASHCDRRSRGSVHCHACGENETTDGERNGLKDPPPRVWGKR